MKTPTPGCIYCGKAPDLLIIWLRDGDTEWVCEQCHTIVILNAAGESQALAEALSIPPPGA